MDTDLRARAQADAKKGGHLARGLWAKINEDWVFNLSGMLAYNYLTATAPLALVILAGAGFALGSISPETLSAYEQNIATHLPAGGAQLLQGALMALRHSAGVLLVIAIITAIFGGSRLFVALENCFAVIYREPIRGIIPQNIVAIGMTILYALLAPLIFIISSAISSVLGALSMFAALPSSVDYLIGLATGVLSASLLFLAIYLFVPAPHRSWRRALRDSWRGALVAAVLLTLYQQLFPLYQHFFLHNAGYGSVAGLAIIAIIFLYYVGFITLLGAEVNAWRAGLRPLNATLPDLFRQRHVSLVNKPNEPEAAPEPQTKARERSAQRQESDHLPSDRGLPSAG
jgi:YihY family inner membrane protein